MRYLVGDEQHANFALPQIVLDRLPEYFWIVAFAQEATDHLFGVSSAVEASILERLDDFSDLPIPSSIRSVIQHLSNNLTPSARIGGPLYFDKNRHANRVYVEVVKRPAATSIVGICDGLLTPNE